MYSAQKLGLSIAALVATLLCYLVLQSSVAEAGAQARDEAGLLTSTEL